MSISTQICTVEDYIDTIVAHLHQKANYGYTEQDWERVLCPELLGYSLSNVETILRLDKDRIPGVSTMEALVKYVKTKGLGQTEPLWVGYPHKVSPESVRLAVFTPTEVKVTPKLPYPLDVRHLTEVATIYSDYPLAWLAYFPGMSDPPVDQGSTYFEIKRSEAREPGWLPEDPSEIFIDYDEDGNVVLLRRIDLILNRIPLEPTVQYIVTVLKMLGFGVDEFAAILGPEGPVELPK